MTAESSPQQATEQQAERAARIVKRLERIAKRKPAGSITGWKRELFMLLARNRSPVTLTALGALTGVFVALLVLSFNLLIFYLSLTLTGADASANELREEGFEQLPTWARFALPAAGGLLVGLLFARLAAPTRFVGIGHVLERVVRHDGKFPLSNLLAQLSGGLIALASGFSLGREAPGVHLGAGLGGQFGERLALPANAVRTLVASGVAAAIAASFNTPLAGVIFAMEVILMEYSIAGFVPIMLAAVSATSVLQLVLGDWRAFDVPRVDLVSVAELPWLIVMGVAIGILSGTFIRLVDLFSRLGSTASPVWRMSAAGVLTGLLAMWLPQIMGTGYDSIDLAVFGEIGLGTAALIVAAKLLASTAAVGLGVPGGLIGPTLVIGALTGTVLGGIGQQLWPNETSSLAFYTLVGMGAMMGATLQAPLAALTALLELTGNHTIVMPVMLVLMTGYLTNRTLFKHEPLFLRVLRQRGAPFKPDPRIIGLQQSSVAAKVELSIIEVPRQLSMADLGRFTFGYQWLLVADENLAIRSRDARRWMKGNLKEVRDVVDLLDIPVGRLPCQRLPVGASLYQAQRLFTNSKAEAVYVTWPLRKEATSATPKRPEVLGILTRDALALDH